MTSRLRNANKIYECFVEVSRPTDTAEAQVRYVYPKDYEWDEDIKKQLPKFTFPTRTSNETEEHFTFVLTDLDSTYRFGFCRYPPKGETCLCFLSDLPWYKVFYRSLDKISDLRLDHQHEVVEPFLAGLRAHPIPTLGMDTVLSVVPEGVDTGQVYTFPLPNPKRLPEIPTDDNFTQFYTNLHYNVILHLFSNLIFERRIIVTSSSLSLLSATVHSVVSLLYPLHWQHIFIPITPPHLLDYCAAPMPFLMGIHSSYMDLVRKMPIEDVVLLDVDESAMESPHVEDLVALPSEVVSELKHVLKKQSSAYGDTVARSFLRAQVSMIGGYRSALKLRQGEKEVVFDEDQFLHSRPNSEEFLEKLLHFQHFRQFMNHKIDKLKNKSLERDRFDEEVMMYEESTDKYKVNFDKFVTSTQKFGESIKESSGKIGRKMKKQAKIVWKKLEKTQYHHPSWQAPHGKTHSLPMHKSASESILPRSTVITPPPTVGGSLNLGKYPKKPPAVIPYHRHKEGKQKLADVLKMQNYSYPGSNQVYFTPPGTPRSAASGDNSERVSLDSRGSADVSIHSGEGPSGEVAVGNLIDISSSSSSPTVEPTTVVLSQSDSSSTDSVSSASSSDNDHSVPTQQGEWVTFDDMENQPPTERPPLPPPRSEFLDIPAPNRSATPVDQPTHSPTPSTNPFMDFDYEAPEQSELNFNLIESDLDRGRTPERAMQNGSSEFESLHLAARPHSPFDDFSTEVAQALTEQVSTDHPRAADTLVNTSNDLAPMVEEDNGFILANTAALEGGGSETDLPQPLIPTTTLAAPTEDVFTELPRSPGHANLQKDSGAQFSSAVATAHTFHTTSSAPALMGASGVYYQQPAQNYPVYNFGVYQHMTYNSKDVRRPSGPRSPRFAQDIPLSLPQVPLDARNMNKRPPPSKPEPYSGSCVNDLEAERRKNDPMFQRLPSIGEFNPFESLLGDGGMEAYVKHDTSKETPLV